jgi:predicted amidohydrolase
MGDKVKIAAVQTDPKIMDIRRNLDKIKQGVQAAAGNGARLIVFPELALTGYVFSDREEAMPYMETIPGPSTDEVMSLCKELGVYVIFGMLEKDVDKGFNAAVLLGPEGLIGNYRKTHLPFLGIDRFLDPGNGPFRVYKTPIGNIGLHICYDCTFPESARVMAIKGADILVLPTNWPEGRWKVVKYVINTRAYENKVHVIATNRAGKERGVGFVGSSKIVNAWGDTLAQAEINDEQIVYAEVDLADARQKQVVLKPGEFEFNFIGDRRPELYSEVVDAGKDSS